MTEALHLDCGGVDTPVKTYQAHTPPPWAAPLGSVEADFLHLPAPFLACYAGEVLSQATQLEGVGGLLFPSHLHAGVQCGGKVMGWGQGQSGEDFRVSIRIRSLTLKCKG